MPHLAANMIRTPFKVAHFTPGYLTFALGASVGVDTLYIQLEDRVGSG